MAIIDRRGLVDDGSANLSVAGTTTVTGKVTNAYTVNSTTTLAGSGSAVSVPTPGYFQVPVSGAGGMGFFTGSVPAAGTYPGSTLILTDTQGNFPWMLTGSSFASGKAVFVTMTTGSTTNNREGGTNLVITKGGSVAFVSDGYYWLLMAKTGSLTLTGLEG